MRRVLLLAAAALLGSACIVHNDTTPSTGSGSVVVYWDFVRNAKSGPVAYDAELAGPTAGACPQSAVEAISIDALDSGVPSATVNCREWNPQDGQAVQGVIIDGVPEGNRSFRIRGWRTVNNQDVAVYDSAVTVSVVHGNVTSAPTAHLAPVRAALDLFGDLAFGPAATATPYASCADAGSPNIGYELRDGVGTLVASGLVGCSDPLPATVFSGDADLDDYTVRMKGYRVSDNSVVFDSCAQSFAHFQADIGQHGVAPVLLTLPVPACQ